MRMNGFENLERKLYNYFNMKTLLDAYKVKIKRLNDKIVEINEKLKKIDINLESDIQAISYSEKIQTSNTGVGYAEKQLMMKVEILINDRARADREVVELEAKRDRLEIDNIIINENFDSLKDEEKEFLKWRYKNKKSNKQIALLMHMSDPTVTRIKKQAIKSVNSWENINLFKI